MPSGRSILALRATGCRISDKGSTGEPTGWMTPTVNDLKNPNPRTLRGGSAAYDNLSREAVGLTAGWPTPNALEFGCRDTERTEQRRQECKERTGNGNGFGLTLGQAVTLNVGGWPTPTSLSFNESHAPGNNRSRNKTVELAIGGWATPAARDYRSEEASEEFNQERESHPRGKPLSYQVQGWPQSSWATAGATSRSGNRKDELLMGGLVRPSSNAGMERPAGLALNPAMSRWLMHFPSSWDHCSPGWKSWQEGQQALKDWHESSGATAPAGLKPTETPSPSPAQ
jgi:hypothetical protein